MGKLKFENSILWLLWIQRRKHGPPLWTGSMDPLSLACARLSDSIVQTYLPSPRAFFAFFFFWTTFHHYLGAWNRLPVMGQVHGNFYIFIERFWFFLNNENWKKKNRNSTKIWFDETLSIATLKVISKGGITRSSTKTCIILRPFQELSLTL